MKLSPEVSSVLSRSRVEGSLLFLPPEQLDRKLYERVNDTITALGGEWNRRQKGHVFPGSVDLQDVLATALTSGAYISPKKEFEVFESTPAICARLIHLADISPTAIGFSGCLLAVLEPSAGPGAIARATREQGLEPECCELMPENRTLLEIQGFELVASDFLDFSPPPQSHFDRVIANPPFSKGQDIAHVRHMWDVLAPGGRITSVMGIGWTFRNEKKYKEFREWAQSIDAQWEELPEGAFKDSGTGVRSGIIVIDRPKQHTMEEDYIMEDQDQDQDQDIREGEELLKMIGAEEERAAATLPAGTADSLLSLTEISRLTGIMYVTLKRYAVLHDATDLAGLWEGEGRNKKYLPEAVEVFRRLKAESRKGRPRGNAAAGAPDRRGVADRLPPHVPKKDSKKKAGGKKKITKPAKRPSLTRETAPLPSASLSTQEADRAMAAIERVQLMAQYEVIKEMVTPWKKEMERLEKVLGLGIYLNNRQIIREDTRQRWQAEGRMR